MQQRKAWILLGLVALNAQAVEAPSATVPSPASASVPAAPIVNTTPSIATTPAIPASATLPSAAGAARLPLDDLRTFVEVFDGIRASYVDTVDDRTLFENAIRGMLSSLDPHSSYLDKKAYEELQRATTGEYDGVGIDIGVEDGVLRVIATIDGEPAAKAGVKSGDYIVKIEGKIVQGMALADAMNLIQGKAGTTLHLTMVRKGEAAREVALVRAHIEAGSVSSRVLESGIVAVRISQFQTHTGRDLKREIEKLKANPAKPVTGLVLDLRNNPGGIVDAAIEVSDAFLDSGVIVSTHGRTVVSETKLSATPGELLPGVPVVVLVDSGTASAAEIVSGALQDNHRALIVGTTTFGKGSVQTVLPIPGGRAIKLTTARYYTPSGRSIQAEGIRPDIEVRPATVNAIAASSDTYHEADLQGHLDNEVALRETGAIANVAGANKAPEKSLLERDYQMAEAVNILKAAAWLKPKPAAASVPASVSKEKPESPESKAKK